MRIKSKKFLLWFFSGVVLSLFALWCFLFLRNQYGPQRAVFYSDANDWFMDFYNTVYYAAGRTPYTWGWLPAHNYLPIAYMLMYPFAVLFPGDIDSYSWRYWQVGANACMIFMVVSIGFLFFALYKAARGSSLNKCMLMAALFFNGVMLYNMDRANQIIFVAGLVCVFLLTYDSRSVWLRHLGFACLAVAAAMKLYPAIYGVLLLAPRHTGCQRIRRTDVVCCVLYGLAAAILPFFWLKGSFWSNVAGFMEALRQHAEVYANGAFGLFAFLGSRQNAVTSAISYAICALSLVIALFFRQSWKSILLISLAVFLTSGQQYIYCGLYLFFPIVLFFNDQDTEPTDIFYLLAFIALLNPVQFHFTLFGRYALTTLGLANAGCVCAMALLLVQGAFEMLHRVQESPRHG